MTAVSVENIFKRYGDTVVFTDFSHAFERGSVTNVMGPSGCGKTTLMRLILGLETPDAGKITVAEGSVLACVFQEDRLINHYSALKNVRLAMPEKNDAAAKELLDELGLSASVHKPVKHLSGGMARRVSIARALLSGANVILLDEPFKGLDKKTREKVFEVIRRRTEGKTLILITHDVTEAQYFGGETVNLKLL